MFPSADIRQRGLMFFCDNGGVITKMPLQAVLLCTTELVMQPPAQVWVPSMAELGLVH